MIINVILIHILLLFRVINKLWTVHMDLDVQTKTRFGSEFYQSTEPVLEVISKCLIEIKFFVHMYIFGPFSYTKQKCANHGIPKIERCQDRKMKQLYKTFFKRIYI